MEYSIEKELERLGKKSRKLQKLYFSKKASALTVVHYSSEVDNLQHAVEIFESEATIAYKQWEAIEIEINRLLKIIEP